MADTTATVALATLQPIVERVRTDATATRTSDGRQTWTRQTLTPERLTRHLNGGPARGVCPIQAGTDTTRCAVLDLDSHKGEVPWTEMLSVAERLTNACAARGLHAQGFRSTGGHGVHLYVLWDEPQDARSVRALLAEVLAACGMRPGTRGVAAGEAEVFPRQDAVPPGGFGNQFILPLAGASVPLLGDPLCAAERDTPVAWRMSESVPRLPPEPARERAPANSRSAELDTLRSALAAVPDAAIAAMGYDEWRNIIYAIHAGTAGSEEGRALAHEFSARDPARYDGDALDAQIWDRADADRQGGITVASVFALARRHSWRESIAEDFLVVAATPAAAEALTKFERRRDGLVSATLHNLGIALARPDVCGVQLARDAFTGRDVIRQPGQDWRPFEDADYVRLRALLASPDPARPARFAEIDRMMMRDAVHTHTQDHVVDTAQEWLAGLPAHDGVERVETFIPRYCSTVDTPYTRAIGRYLWTALAGRVVAPGCVADMVPVLIGDQGVGKTRGVRALAPLSEAFCEVNLADRDRDQSRLLRGKIVGELPELRGLGGRQSEDIKAWLSQTHEEWVPKYLEKPTRFARRVVFVGTTNDRKGFLFDETGNRRWLPVDCGSVDVAAIERDREQLWAEARALHAVLGVAWAGEVTGPEAEEARKAHEHMDDWAPVVADWLDRPGINDQAPRQRPYIRTLDVLTGALGMAPAYIERKHQIRAGGVLRALGYARRKVWEGDRAIWAFSAVVLSSLLG